MSHSKPLIIPWLRSHIDSGKYPGVQWTNQERTEFSIPWKHALRQDSSDADILIFKVIHKHSHFIWHDINTSGSLVENDQIFYIHSVSYTVKVCSVMMVSSLQAWAEVSGGGRAHGDASVWKRNFRSALRAKGFKLVTDNKNDAANPHKVFRWPEESASGGEDPLGRL